MATFTVTTTVNMDALTSKGGADTYNVNGGTITQDRHTRYGLNPSNSHGNINGSATLGGTIKFRSDKIRLIYFTNGTGNVPAYETVISQGSASGLLIGVHSALNSAPITPGSAMPSSGYLQVTQWNNIAYASGALTGIGADCTADPVFGTFDRVGFMIVVGRDSTNTNVSRLNNPTDDPFNNGVYTPFLVGITDGTRATAYQIPNNGDAMYFGGVEVETAPSSGIYEWWPVTTSAMTAYNLRTTGGASKQCWIDPANAQIRFGHDGTNSTGGQCPASGCIVRIPNMFLQSCTAGSPTTNSFSAIGSRHYFYANGAGRYRMTGVSSAWRSNLMINAYELYLKDSSFCQTMTITSNATAFEFDNICLSTPVDDGIANNGLVLTNSLIGGTVENSVFGVGKIDGVNKSTSTVSGSSNVTFTDCKFLYSGMPNTNTNAVGASIAANFSFQSCYFVGKHSYSQCTDVTAQNCVIGGVTAGDAYEGSGNNDYIALSNKSSGFLFEDWTSEVTDNLFRANFISLGASSSNNKFRNMGERGNPIIGRSAIQYDLPWTRSGTTITVTWTGHPLRTGDFIKTLWSSSTAATGAAGFETATYINANSFSFVGVNSGDASGTVTLFRTQVSDVVSVGAGCENNEFQNIFVDGAYSDSLSVLANTNSNTFLNISGGLGASTVYAGNDMIVRGVDDDAGIPSASAAQYGHTFADSAVQSSPTATGAVGASWSRTSNVITVTTTDHGIEAANTRIRIYDPSDVAPVGLSSAQWKYATPLTKDTFSFTGAASGASSGTLSWDAPADKLTLYMNEQSDSVTRYTIDSGTPAFTGAGALSAVTVGDQITWEMPEFLINYTGFFNAPIETSLAETEAAQGVYRFMYDIATDDGAYSGSFKNLSLVLAATGGTSGAATMTFADTTMIAANDKIYGYGVPRGAYVVSVDSATQITISANMNQNYNGSYSFNHLPVETFTTNFKLKVRQTTLTTNTLSNIYINIPLTSDATSRAEVYPIQAVAQSFSLTALPTGAEIVLIDTDTETELDRETVGGSTYTYIYQYTAPTNALVLVWHEDYMIQTYEVVLGGADQSFPVVLTDDNVYITERDYTDIVIDYDNTLITLDSGVTRLNVPEIYSRWKDDVLIDTNILYPLAFIATGGQLLNGDVYSPKVVYLNASDGWGIKPDEVDHTVNVTDGFLYTDDESDPFVNTIGAYTVRIVYKQPNEALTIATGGGGGSTPADIWSYSSRTLTGIGSSGIASEASATTNKEEVIDSVEVVEALSDEILSNTDATQAKVDQL